jgi:hypothetical protein
LFGCFIPLRLQDEVGQELQKLDVKVNIVTIVVDLSADSLMLKGELETWHKIDKIDPQGIFTAKLIYEKMLPYDPKDETLSIVDGNLSTQEKAADAKKQQNGTQKDAVQQFHLRLRMWMNKKANLHFIYMVYAGKTMKEGLPKNLTECTVYKAFKNLLLNYRILNHQKICHMDLHAENITYDVSTADELSFKFIDFGYNIQYKHERVNGKGPIETVADVTEDFLCVCKIMTDTLRDWHPVEYVMFHFCICMMLGPFCVANSTWTPAQHIDKTNAMLEFVATTSCDELTDFGAMTSAYHTEFRNSKTEFCSLWKRIFKTYACIEPILMERWRRICHIVGKLVIINNTKDGKIVEIKAAYRSLFHSNNNFTDETFFATYLQQFRTRYYCCATEDMNVINGEFDVFSLGVLILQYYQNKDIVIKNVILGTLFSNTYAKSARQRLTETAEAIQRLEVTYFDLT